MATEPSRTIGKCDCVVCGEEIPVRQNGRDTLNISCPWCGVSAYVKAGSEAHRKVSGWIRKPSSPGEPEKTETDTKPKAAAGFFS